MPGERWGRMAGMHVESLGLSPLKGTSWLQRDVVDLTRHGLAGDRRWSPVGPDLRCVKATDVPWLAGVRVTPADLPPPQSALHGGEQRTVMYYDRAFRCQLHDGELAARLSEAAGRELLLARTTGEVGFIWSSPVSVLLRSEISELPGDTGRYRPNVVLDDRAAPLQLAVGDRLDLGEVVLQVERPLERCLVIDHDPVTGRRDQRLLGRLRPGVLLGWGCRVVRPGALRVGAVNAS